MGSHAHLPAFANLLSTIILRFVPFLHGQWLAAFYCCTKPVAWIPGAWLPSLWMAFGKLGKPPSEPLTSSLGHHAAATGPLAPALDPLWTWSLVATRNLVNPKSWPFSSPLPQVLALHLLLGEPLPAFQGSWHFSAPPRPSLLSP